MTDTPIYTLDRDFDAPRELVWRCWTDPTLIVRWYGPGVDESVVEKQDLTRGGLWLHRMVWGGKAQHERMEFVEVQPPSRLTWLHAMADQAWQAAANPMMPDWPRVLLATLDLQDLGPKTRMRFTWAPHQATEAEIACFAAAISGAGRGWGMGMDLMETLLAELQGRI